MIMFRDSRVSVFVCLFLKVSCCVVGVGVCARLGVVQCVAPSRSLGAWQVREIRQQGSRRGDDPRCG